MPNYDEENLYSININDKLTDNQYIAFIDFIDEYTPYLIPEKLPLMLAVLLFHLRKKYYAYNCCNQFTYKQKDFINSLTDIFNKYQKAGFYPNSFKQQIIKIEDYAAAKRIEYYKKHYSYSLQKYGDIELTYMLRNAYNNGSIQSLQSYEELNLLTSSKLPTKNNLSKI